MADFEGDKGCGPTHHACECFQRRLREAQEERDRWAEAATIQNGEIEACLTELEKAGWNGPASSGVEWLRAERDAAIEWAEAAEAEAKSLLTMPLNERIDKLAEALQAAETKLAEQRALAERGKEWALEQLNDPGHHERYRAALRGVLCILQGGEG